MISFRNRLDAGKQLAKIMASEKTVRTMHIFALPRGGVPVGYAIARELDLPLSVLVVRKLGAPWQPELALGAIASGGICFLNENLIASLGVSKEGLEKIVARETVELHKRETRYGVGHDVGIRDKHVLFVDDGIATGASMLAAIEVAQHEQAASINVAVPVASPQVRKTIQEKTRHFYCLSFPSGFYAVGSYYNDFSQTTDEEVRELLQNR